MVNSIHRGPNGEPVGVSFKGDSLKDRWRGGSGNGASLCMGALWGEP